MKKSFALLLVLAMMLALTACGKSKAAKEVDEQIAAIGTVTLDSGSAIQQAEKAVEELEDKDRESLDNIELLSTKRSEYDNLLLSDGPWLEINNGDEYLFNSDGVGTHDDISIKYEISEGKVITTEGAAGTTKAVLSIDESDTVIKLVPEDGNGYYVRDDDYSVISEGIRAEHTKELTSHEAWAVHNGPRFVMYFMFAEGGGGFALFTSGTNSLNWEYEDNDTLKITITTDQKMTALYDIVNEDGSYKLVQVNNTNVVATPHN